MYVKVVDADDWVGPESLEQVMAVLRGEVGKDEPLDMLVTNYVYDKVGKRNKHEGERLLLLHILPRIGLVSGRAAGRPLRPKA